MNTTTVGWGDGISSEEDWPIVGGGTSNIGVFNEGAQDEKSWIGYGDG